MSNKLAIAAVALMAFSAPASASPESDEVRRLPEIINVYKTEYSRDCAKGGNSAARGSIYNMAGPCGSTSIKVKTGDNCWWTNLRGRWVIAGSNISNQYLADKAQKACRDIVMYNEMNDA